MPDTPQSHTPAPARRFHWLNSTVLGIGLASLFSDWSHEIATAAMPAFLATMGVAAAWIGLIEGVSDGLSSFAKLASGHFTDRLERRKPIAVAGYVITALGTASFGLATSAWHVLLARATAWLGRGVRTPVRKALLAASVSKEAYGRAFGLERAMDTLGAIVGPASGICCCRRATTTIRRSLRGRLCRGCASSAASRFSSGKRRARRWHSFRFEKACDGFRRPFGNSWLQSACSERAILRTPC